MQDRTLVDATTSLENHSHGNPMKKTSPDRGWAIAVPGLLPDRISKELLQAAYVYIDRYEVLLKVAAMEKGRHVEVSFQSDPFRARMDTIKVNALACQRGTSVRDLARIIVLDRGLARKVSTPKRWLCERHARVVSENAAWTGACVPLGTGIPGEFKLLWGCQPAAPAEAVADNVEDSPEEECYQITPLANIYGLLEKAHQQDALADQTPDLGWWCRP